MRIQQTLNNIEGDLENLISDLKKEIENFKEKDIEIPDWKEIQKKKNLYMGYREVTIANNRLNKLLVQLGDVILSVKKLKNSLQINEEITQRILKKIRGKLDGYLSKLYQYQKILANEKDSLDQTLRFYHSAQYILGSPRLSGMD